MVAIRTGALRCFPVWKELSLATYSPDLGKLIPGNSLPVAKKTKDYDATGFCLYQGFLLQ